MDEEEGQPVRVISPGPKVVELVPSGLSRQGFNHFDDLLSPVALSACEDD
jgi:hypothetical protein